MEESLREPTTQGSDELSLALRAQREAAHRFFRRYSASNEQIEQQLLAQVDAVMRQISELNDGAAPEGLSQVAQQLTAHESQLGKLVEDLAERHAAVAQAEGELAAERRALDERQAALQADALRLHEEHRMHEIAAAEVTERALEVDQQVRLLEQRGRELEELSANLQAREAQLAAARKHLARDLRLKRAEHLADIESRREKIDQASAAEDAELELQLAQFTAELSRVRQQTSERGEQVDRLRQELDNARAQLGRREAENRELSLQLEQIANSDHYRSTETAALGAQLAEARERAESQHAAAQVALSQARDDHEQLRSELAQARKREGAAQKTIEQLEADAEQLQQQIAGAGDEAAAERIKELEHERDALVERLNDAEQMPSIASVASEESEALRRRFEMALDDLRSLKARNAELEEKLSRSNADGKSAVAVGDSKMDWESQKRRMLAQLEADFDESDPQEAEDKLTVEGTIQITDGIVGQKDREIVELQRLLDEQSRNIGGVAVGAAAIAQMLDGDELIRGEREKLEAMQNEWREKLRKAEIDISVERAKIARDRAQLEDKLQSLAAHGEAEAAASDDGGKKKKGSRWLSRLGLSEDQK